MVDTEIAVYFDVDKTLIFDLTSEEVGSIIEGDPNYVHIGEGIFKRPFRINHKMIDKIYFHKAAGHEVIVWSKSGKKYARNVVLALGLNQFVDDVKSKPLCYYDDADCTVFMGNRLYVE